jgi:hypothetical protein
MTADAVPHSRGIIGPSLANSPPSKSEGAGNAGCWPHPQPCVQMKKARKQVTTGSAETVRHSLRDGFSGCFVLSLVCRA